MKVYVGQTRARKLIGELASLGIGECTNRDEFPPRRTPWFLDNGAFKDWTSGRPFEAFEFLFAFQAAARHPNPPDFVVVPDIVAGGKESTEFSIRWGRDLYGHFPLYVALQDGMDERDYDLFASCFWVDGFFVGGTLEWKLKNGRRIVDFAHSVNRPCHIGRVGTAKRVRWARMIGADSIDSSLPLWSKGNLAKFLYELDHPMLPETH